MLHIDQPFHGAVLNHRHGQQTDAGLTLTVTGTAPRGEAVTVNGQPAQRDGQHFTCPITLREHETDIVARCDGVHGNQEHRVRVVWDRHSFPRYRVAIDDNIFFLVDLVQRNHKSLFDNFYLAGLRDLNQRYGAKFVLNLFYTSGKEHPDMTLSLPDVSDRYKGEWEDNADWLKLAFHAYTEFPARPYQEAKPEKLAADFDLVNNEILRFAGEAACSPPTVVHYAMVHPGAWQVLVDRGVKMLSGFFRKSPNGAYDINYWLDETRSEHAFRHHLVKDFATGLVFSCSDCVINSTPIEKIVPMLEQTFNDPRRAEIMDLFTHEQYFFPFYKRHIPDHMQRMETAIRFCTERGYKPVFFHEGFLGAPE